MAKARRKNRGRKVLVTVLIILAVLIAAVAVAVRVLRERVSETFASKTTDEIQSATVTRGSISTTISGNGTLSQEEAISVTLPHGIVLQTILVEKDDSVEAGQKIAQIHLPSVLTEINSLQDELDELDAEISDAAKDTVDTYIRSAVKGRVKEIRCQAGDSVLSVMHEKEALLVLSLDGYLALDIEGDFQDIGNVSVRLSGGTVYPGTVSASKDGKTVILITDNKPLVGDSADVFTADGTELGSGTLYVHQPLLITGYAGTVNRINVRENQQVAAKTVLLTLKDTAFTANYESLLEQRAELEKEFNELVKLYKAGAIYAPVSGKAQEITEEEPTENIEDTWTVTDIIPQEQMIVTASVSETDILSVSIGQEADVTISSISSNPFRGSVTSIEKVGTSSNGVTTYSVEVTMDRTEKMLPNMSASVSIRIEGVDNALLVPEDAVTRTRDTSYVYTSVDETSGELSGMIEVKTGLSGGGYIEITEGLKEGDTVRYKKRQSNDFSQFMNNFSGFNSGGNNRPNNNNNWPNGGNNNSGSNRRRSGGD